MSSQLATCVSSVTPSRSVSISSWTIPSSRILSVTLAPCSSVMMKVPESGSSLLAESINDEMVLNLMFPPSSSLESVPEAINDKALVAKLNDCTYT